MSILPTPPTTNITPAVLAVAHPDWCDTAECTPTADYGHDGLGLVVHRGVVLDVDGLRVEVACSETYSPRGDLHEQDQPVVLVEGVSWDRELTSEQAAQLAAAVARAATVAGGCPVKAPDARPDTEHLDRAADLVLAVIAPSDPGYRVRPEAHDALVDLLESVVSAILVGRRSRWPSISTTPRRARSVCGASPAGSSVTTWRSARSPWAGSASPA